MSCCRYDSGAKVPDHDAADAFLALSTALLHAEGECRPVIPEGAPMWLHEREGPSGCLGSFDTQPLERSRQIREQV